MSDLYKSSRDKRSPTCISIRANFHGFVYSLPGEMKKYSLSRLEIHVATIGRHCCRAGGTFNGAVNAICLKKHDYRRAALLPVINVVRRLRLPQIWLKPIKKQEIHERQTYDSRFGRHCPSFCNCIRCHG